MAAKSNMAANIVPKSFKQHLNAWDLVLEDKNVNKICLYAYNQVFLSFLVFRSALFWTLVQRFLVIYWCLVTESESSAVPAHGVPHAAARHTPAHKCVPYPVRIHPN